MILKPALLKTFFAFWAIGLVLLHLLAAVSGSGLLWGVDFWSYFPPLWAYLLAGLGLVASVPSLAQAAFSFLSPELERFFRFFEGRKAYLGALSISAAAGLSFWIFRCRIHLLGDGQWWIRNLELNLKFWKNEPLSLYLNWLVYKTGALFPGFTAREAFQITSVCSGVVFVFILFWLARRIGRGFAERVLVFAGLITLGTVELFFGYVETYPLLNAAVIAYLFLTVRMLQGRGGLFWVVSVFWLSVMMHLSVIVMFPSLVYLYFDWWKGSKEVFAEKVKKLLVFLFGPVAVVGLLMYAMGFDLSVLFSPKEGISNILIPLVGEESRYFNYRLFSMAHFAALANLLLLVSPFMVPFCFLPVRCWKNLSRVQSFLLVVSVFSLVFVFFFNSELGFPRDWDIFAYAFIAPTLLGLSLFIEHSKGDIRFTHYAAVLAVVVGGIHMVPWVLVNADEELSLARYERILSGGSLHSVHARAFGHEEVAIYYRERELYAQAESHFRKAIEADSSSYRLYTGLAGAYQGQGKLEDVRAALKHAVKLEPENLMANYNFALFLHETDSLDQSLHYFRKVIEIKPDYIPALLYLGLIYLKLEDYSQALDHYQRVLQLDPDNKYAVKNLKILLKRLKELSARGDSLQ
ncbi:MAG TPA: tetratricopeptide repeat protein [archaeon]|nr:tetratricopeptide repeat protein [archaeon]